MDQIRVTDPLSLYGSRQSSSKAALRHVDLGSSTLFPRGFDGVGEKYLFQANTKTPVGSIVLRNDVRGKKKQGFVELIPDVSESRWILKEKKLKNKEDGDDGGDKAEI